MNSGSIGFLLQLQTIPAARLQCGSRIILEEKSTPVMSIRRRLHFGKIGIENDLTRIWLPVPIERHQSCVEEICSIRTNASLAKPRPSIVNAIPIEREYFTGTLPTLFKLDVQTRKGIVIAGHEPARQPSTVRSCRIRCLKRPLALIDVR